MNDILARFLGLPQEVHLLLDRHMNQSGQLYWWPHQTPNTRESMLQAVKELEIRRAQTHLSACTWYAIPAYGSIGVQKTPLYQNAVVLWIAVNGMLRSL